MNKECSTGDGEGRVVPGRTLEEAAGEVGMFMRVQVRGDTRPGQLSGK